MKKKTIDQLCLGYALLVNVTRTPDQEKEMQLIKKELNLRNKEE